MSTHSPFFASAYIQSPELFVGRNYELTFIAHRMAGAQPTSVNVYGPRRIGKSSLLYHFYQTWENRIEPSERQKFAVAYVSVAKARTEKEFYQELAKIYREYARLQKEPTWRKIWHSADWTRQDFNDALKDCREKFKVLPVLCLDDMETMLKHSQEFDNGFYDNLRAAMSSSQLMLVIASFEPLHAYKARYRLTSLFFNQGQALELKKFEPAEVEALLLLADKAQFNDQQKKRMRQWGEQHPYLLQLAGVWLWEAQVDEKDEKFAKRGFEEDKRHNLYPTPENIWEKLLKPFKWLGQLAEWFAEKWHHAHLTVIGMVIAIAVIVIFSLGIHWSMIHLAEHPFEYFKQIWHFFFDAHSGGH